MHFPVYGGILSRQTGEVRAVDGVSFTLVEGETLGLVGESGCGKSTTGKCLINLYPPTAGEVVLHSKKAGGGKRNEVVPVDLAHLSNAEMRPFRSEIQMIFQDPYASLNPRMTVREIVSEPLSIHEPQLSSADLDERISRLLTKVGLQGEQAFRYPHEFSGGQRQRIGIARALATNPRLLIADEPVSALDVSIQAQVINLMRDLQKEFGLTYLFITHNLAVVEHVSDRIAVMYLGNIVEIGKTEEIFTQPLHPYTRALLSAIPSPDPRRKRRARIVLQGDVPTPLHKPSGCGFRTRCPIARDACAQAVPPLRRFSDTHSAACPFVEFGDDVFGKPLSGLDPDSTSS
jgi:oligopeptide transport system ATP-binding protein